MYRDLNTVVHGLDPRTKLICFLVLTLAPLALNDPLYVLGVGVVVLGIAWLAGCTDTLVRLWRVYLLLIGVNTVLWQLYSPGTTTLVAWGPVEITREGLLFGFAASLRFALVLMIGTIFVSCVSTEEISVGLVHLKVPYVIAFLFAMALRLLPTFITTGQIISEAQRARGFEATSQNPLRRLTQVFPLIIPVTMYGLRQAAKMSLSLEARGFRPGARRSSLVRLSFTRADALAFATVLSLVALCLAMRFNGYGAVIQDRI
ncbi:energy-coupling factor transporter transmembrane component T family protein [Streptomyces sp. NPDC060053]|uniref:energy-coupling factor transporter transmembrane component T family protein n=1 Tax=Streptomyces sp. NPDC060053 TaxID=3347047 RepID=UPI0036A1C3CE